MMTRPVKNDTDNIEPESDTYAIARKSADTNIDRCRKILNILFNDYQGPVSIRLWSDVIIIGQDNAICTLVFNRPYPIRHIVLGKDLNHLAEAHLKGDVEAEGDLEILFDLVDYIQDKVFTPTERLKILMLALKITNNENKGIFHIHGTRTKRERNTKNSIAHHYDISNAFYRLFLGPEMVYSCAYFSHSKQTLAEAQRDKLDYICRKLRLKKGQTMLDIGCGWGGLALWAAQQYGVKVHGITLSQQQYAYAVERSKALKLDSLVSFELLDYRELPDDIQYDRIVSVGMFEHIGIDHFPHYFNTINRLLNPDGLFLNHGITNDTGWQQTPITRFINKYIFPDGELARISDVITSMENAGFEILDTEALRAHYNLTLRNWVKGLKYNREKAIAIADEATYKLWRLYMAGSAHYFNRGCTNVYQILAGKNSQPWLLPLRRDDLYQ